MAINTYAQNRVIAFRTAAKKTGLSYDEVKTAYNSKEKLDGDKKRAVEMAHAILRNYGKAYRKNQNVEGVTEVAEPAVAVETAE